VIIMHMKIGNFVAVFALLLAGPASSLQNDTAATDLQKTNPNPSTITGYRQPAGASVSYETVANTNNAGYGADASVTYRSSVSAVPEVKVSAVLLAILGLAGLRLQRGGKKYLPAIN
jgi:hypothetical protein